MVLATYLLHWPEPDLPYLRCQLLLHREFKNDVPEPDVVLRRFQRLYSGLPRQEQTPILQDGGINFLFIWCANDIVLLSVAKFNVNAMLTITFLGHFHHILTQYFQLTKEEEDESEVILDRLASQVLNSDTITDNYALVYDVLDECMDFGLAQHTDFNTLKEYVKTNPQQSALVNYESNSDSEAEHEHNSKRKNKHKALSLKKDINIKSSHNQTIRTDVGIADTLVNSSILRTQSLAISWRPKGIFYPKNEIYIDIEEQCIFEYDLETQRIKQNRVEGRFQIRCYLSGMPVCKLGLNEKYISQVDNTTYEEEEDQVVREGNQLPDPSSHDPELLDPSPEPLDQTKRLKVPIENVQFHQCIELDKVYKDNLIAFIPPDDNFQLLSYTVDQQRRRDKKPLLLVEPVYRLHKSTRRLQVMCTVKLNFRKRLHCRKLCVRLPVNPLLFRLANQSGDHFRFKAEFGDVSFGVDSSELVWDMKDLPGSKKCVRMMAEVQLDRNLDLSSEQISFLFERTSVAKDSEERWDEKDNELDRYYGVGGLNSSLFMRALEHATQEGLLNEVLVEFDIPMLAYSGLRVTYFRVDEELMKYTSFPWVRYRTLATAQKRSFRFFMGPSCLELV